MTLQEIDSIVLNEGNLKLIIGRILDITVVPFGEAVYSIDEDEEKPFYDRIFLSPRLVKPSKARFDEEVEDYKAELRAVEEARVAEIQRVEDIKQRFYAISEIRAAIEEAGLDIKNPEAELKRIIKDDDQATLAALESAAASAGQKIQLKKNISSRISRGAQARGLCNSVLDLIAGHNIENELAGADLDALTQTYEPILSALQQARPLKAKALIVAVVPDGALITQQMKDEVLALYTEAGL